MTKKNISQRSASFFWVCILLLDSLCLGSISLNSQTKYELNCNPLLLNKSKQILLEQVGEREQKPNDSPKIRNYLVSVGINYPAPYCAAGQYYCFSKAANMLQLQHTEIPIKQTALANAIYTNAKQIGAITNYKAQDNDLIIWRKGNSIFGHIERIITVGKCGWVQTVGFNTGSGNARDGDGVYIRKRNIYHPLQRMTIRGLIGFRGATQ